MRHPVPLPVEPMKCPNCGTENHEDARFCKSCAAPQTPPAASPPAPAAPLAPPSRPPWFVAPHHPKLPYEDLLGLLGFAFFLTGVVAVFGTNPNFVSDLGRWTDLVSSSRTVFARPPDGIIRSAATFFAVVGVLDFASAFLRWAVRWPPLRAASRVLTGVGDLIFVALLLRYADRAISGAFLITILVGVFAVLLTVYVTLGVYWSAGRPTAWPYAVQPPLRQ